MSNVKIWIKSFRLRTLPLALSSTFTGSFLAFPEDKFRWDVFILAGLTTLFLQILSNLANDYGDFSHGTDNENRTGPKRALMSGQITKQAMKKMILSITALSLISGSLLIYTSLSDVSFIISSIFLLVGLLAIWAAIKYTVGKNPYGYSGFGDIFVFIFFGIVGVCGTYYLHTQTFNPWILFPASSIGLFSCGVLNLNNMRDIKNDKNSGKHTLVVRMGPVLAKYYHLSLILIAIIMTVVYTAIFWNSYFQLLYLVAFPLFISNILVVFKTGVPEILNSELKKLSIATFIFAITFGLGFVF